MTDITELAQSHELLIANGQQTADLLRHLADNEIDSDYFAVVSECESYGKETDAELSITEFALRAAGYVDALVEALEKAQDTINEMDNRIRKQNRHVCELFDDNTALRQRIAELEEAEQQLCSANVTLDARAELAERQLAELESRTVTVKLPQAVSAGGQGYQEKVERILTAAGIKWEAE